MNQNSARTILILEDEPLIALDLQTMLEAEGFRNIEVIGNCADAEIWVTNRTPSVALIDVRLKDGSSAGVATMLRDRSVPMIVCSGTAKAEADAAFSSATWVRKPCTPAELTSAVYSAWDLQQD
jgi:DNA-binding NtrC family response regulator